MKSKTRGQIRRKRDEIHPRHIIREFTHKCRGLGSGNGTVGSNNSRSQEIPVGAPIKFLLSLQRFTLILRSPPPSLSPSGGSLFKFRARSTFQLVRIREFPPCVSERASRLEYRCVGILVSQCLEELSTELSVV